LFKPAKSEFIFWKPTINSLNMLSAKVSEFFIRMTWPSKCLLVLVLLILTFKNNGLAIRTGLDPSWLFGINYFFAHSIQFGSEVVFTYGPLGFLSHAVPIGNNFEIALFFWTAVQFIFLWLLFSVVSSYHKDSPHWLTLMAVFLLLTLVNSMSFGFLPIFLVFTSILLFALENKPFYFIFSVLCATLFLLIKTGTGSIYISTPVLLSVDK